MSGKKPRIIASQVLASRGAGEYIEDALEAALDRARLSSPDRRLCQELVYGTVRWQSTLDWLITRKTDNRAQKPALQTLLRLGLYQIFWLNRIPNHAAVHETVEMAKHAGFSTQAGFVNALLRGYLREFDVTRQLLDELKTTQPALGHSHPEWLVARWQKRWGSEKAAQLMAWNNTPPKIFARVNTLKTDAAGLLPQWRDEDVEYDFFARDWLPENLIFELKSYPPLARLPSFQQGLFYVQDPSTLLAVAELNPQPRETILDLCAAPGGKLTYIAQLVRNEAILLAYDLSPERMALIQQNCQRLGITSVEPATLPPVSPEPPTEGGSTPDTRHPPPGTPHSIDRLLIDAPCSNTGVMRRRVDLRWRIRLEELKRLRAAQLNLLAQAAPLLKPGGTLLYSTCSLEPEENQDVIREFLQAHPRFTLHSERELLPFTDRVDGAYTAHLLRLPSL